MIIPNQWKNKQCSKPPTRKALLVLYVWMLTTCQGPRDIKGFLQPGLEFLLEPGPMGGTGRNKLPGLDGTLWVPCDSCEPITFTCGFSGFWPSGNEQTNSLLLNMAIEQWVFRLKMSIFHSYVSLPEGMIYDLSLCSRLKLAVGTMSAGKLCPVPTQSK